MMLMIRKGGANLDGGDLMDLSEKLGNTSLESGDHLGLRASLELTEMPVEWVRFKVRVVLASVVGKEMNHVDEEADCTLRSRKGSQTWQG